jgi:signal transduction histidine kinase/PAS domain-containing protein
VSSKVHGRISAARGPLAAAQARKRARRSLAAWSRFSRPLPAPRVVEEDMPRYGDLYDRAPVGLLTLDGYGRVLEANAQALAMLRVRRATLLGRPLALQVSPGDHRHLTHHLYRTLHSTTTCSCEVVFERPGSRVRLVGHLESMAVVDFAGRRECRMAISDATARRQDELDHAERRHREQVLRDESAVLRRRADHVTAAGGQLAESLDLDTCIARAARIALPDLGSYCAIDLVDAHGHVRRAAFARQDGSEADLPLDPYAPHGSAAVVRSGSVELHARPTTGDLLGLLTDPAGLSPLRAHVASYLCVPLRAHGRTVGAMVLARRSGAPYDAEDTALAEELARQAALAIDNARLYCEAQQTDQRKDEFLAMLGHELRNPLAAVVFAATSLRRRDGADAPSLRIADVLERQAARLVRLVDDLLDVSRVTQGRIILRREPVLLCDVVTRAIESTRPLFEANHHHLEVTCEETGLVLDADPTRLEQAVTNLLANAAKYTDPGGRVWVVLERRGAEAVLRVRDTGVGLSEEMLPRIFAPFTQVNPTPDRTDRGLGIGLTLSRTLVELHGGKLSARSAGLGQGSEFVMRLPLAEEATAAPVATPPDHGAAAEAPVRRSRVLVVEDNKDLADLLQEQLESLGQDVRVADDGDSAIRVARDFRPGLLLIDIGLPGMTGYELAAKLRQEPATSGATLVAVTGYGGADTTSKCLAAGFDRHFTKPIGEDALEGLLRAPVTPAA